jgi:peptidoglycan/LPS O-acetylase OafA/YrhL/glycosyltransferase involved in cell wall biosynthesis
VRKAAPAGRLDTLTALRAVAAFLVFTRHSSDFIFRHAGSPFTRQGATGVSFFFLLSGFVLAWSARPGDTASGFYRRRFARIYPAYIAVLLLAQGTMVLRSKVSVGAFLANGLLVQSWIPRSSVYFASDMGAWSLGCELFFYLLFPLVLPVLMTLSARRRWQLAGLAAGFEVAMALATHSPSQTGGAGLWLVYVLPLTRFGEFLIGMTLALAVKDGFRPRVTLGQALAVAGAAYLAAGFVPVWLMWVAVTLVPFGLLVVTAAVWDIEGRPTRLRSPWMIRFGHWSFAFYLVHISVVTVFQHLAGPHDGVVVQVPAATAALLVAVGAAGLVHTLIERPAERRLRGGKTRAAEGPAPVHAEGVIDPDGYRDDDRSSGSGPAQPATPDPGPDRAAGRVGGTRHRPGRAIGRAGGVGRGLGASAPAGAAVDHAAADPVQRAVLQQLRIAPAPGVQGPDLPGGLHGGWAPRAVPDGPGPGQRALRDAVAAAGAGDVDLRAWGPGDGRVRMDATGAVLGVLRDDLTAGRPEHQLAGRRAVGAPAERLRSPVLIVMHYFPPHIGGMEEVGGAQAASLAAKGHPVEVLTCAHGRGLPRTEPVAGYRVRRVRALNFLERRYGVTFPIIGPLGAARIFRQVRRTDVVHIHDVFYPTSHVAVAAARLLRRPYYLTQHVAMVPHPSRLVMTAQRLIYSTVGGSALRHAARVVVYNARVRDFVVEMGVAPGSVVLNHNGIDTDVFSPQPDEGGKADLRRRYGLPADRPVVLFVGRLVPKKGFDLVIRAASPEWTTLIVGEGAGAPTGGGPDVVMFGAAGRRQLVDLYRLSDVFVFPAEGEMLTLVMQEAMAAGLPVVTTDDPAYREYDLDRELIAFVERGPEPIREAIATVLSTPGRAAAMSSYSRSVAVERFGWAGNYTREYSIYPAPADAPEPEGVELVPNLAG